MFLVFLFSYILLLTGLPAIVSFESENNTYIENLPYKRYLSTKTPYRFIGNPNVSQIEFEGCSATRIWAVYRHGTRTPGPGTMNAAYKRLAEIRDAIAKNNKYAGKIAKWQPHHELDDKKRLTSMGVEEMIHLGKRLRKRFPSLLPDSWNNDTFVVRATATTRAQDSARSFLTGLFNEKEAEQVWIPTPLKKDPILRFYKLCPRWREDVKKNPNTKKEVEKFIQGKLFSKMVRDVTIKYHLPDKFLDTDDIQLMYTMCCFETSWERENESVWCKLFEKNDFKVLEYAEDMEYFWIDGFGNSLTIQLACPMFQDAFSHMNDDRKKPFVFYFTHSGTILKFLTHLGLYRDQVDLLSHNFDKHSERSWRTSKIDSFAANIAFVRYDCDDGNKYILTLHQERPIRLPGCPRNTELCNVDTIRKLYRNSLENCDYDTMCNIRDSKDQGYWSMIMSYIWKSYDSFRKLYLY